MGIGASVSAGPLKGLSSEGSGASTLHPPGWTPGQEEDLGTALSTVVRAVNAPRCF